MKESYRTSNDVGLLAYYAFRPSISKDWMFLYRPAIKVIKRTSLMLTDFGSVLRNKRSNTSSAARNVGLCIESKDHVIPSAELISD